MPPKNKRSARGTSRASAGSANVTPIPDFAQVQPVSNQESRSLPFVNRETLAEIRKGLKTNPTSIRNITKKPNLNNSDVRELCLTAKKYGWLAIDQENDGTVIQFASPTGFTVLSLSEEKKHKLPSLLVEVLADLHIFKVQSAIHLDIAVIEKCSGVRIRGAVDIQSLSVVLFNRAEKPGMSEYAKDIDDFHHVVDYRLQPYRNPTFLTQEALLHAVQDVRAAANAIWSAAVILQGTSDPSSNLLQWTRQVFAQFLTLSGCPEPQFSRGNGVEITASLLKNDVYYVEIDGVSIPEQLPEENPEVFTHLRSLREDLVRSDFCSPDLSQFCSKCGTKGIHDCIVQGAPQCCYLLCPQSIRSQHNLFVCPSLLNLCETCGRRGHYPDDHLTRSQTHLENAFLLFSRFHLLVGSIWEAKPVLRGHWLLFLYGQEAWEVPKLVLCTKLSLPSSHESINTEAQRQLMAGSILGNEPSLTSKERKRRALIVRNQLRLLRLKKARLERKERELIKTLQELEPSGDIVPALPTRNANPGPDVKQAKQSVVYYQDEKPMETCDEPQPPLQPDVALAADLDDQDDLLEPGAVDGEGVDDKEAEDLLKEDDQDPEDLMRF